MRIVDNDYLIKKCKRMMAVLCCLLLFGASISQAQDLGRKISLTCKDMPLTEALNQVERHSDFKLNFNYEELSRYRVNAVISKKTAPEAVDILLQSTPFKKTVTSNFIVISRQRVVVQQRQAQGNGIVRIHGKVMDNTKNPLPGVNIMVKGYDFGATTNSDGSYVLGIGAGLKKVTLFFTFIGMKTVSVDVRLSSLDQQLDIIMEENSNELGEVVVTGMFNRRAESFTGSASTYKHDEIMNAGSENLLKSLKNLDPSFQILDNLEAGSDPNTMPTLQMRGQTSFPNLEGDYSGNPNEPLFILDGFETTLQKIYDLDMTRIESITILKDAAAKAIYGAKAANGVVVVKTISPKMGRLVVSYNGNLSLEVPDLTGYNLMNAQEKFDFEVDRGFYYNSMGASINDARYKIVHDNLLRGVNTYWLSKPLQTGIGQKHSLSFEGGDGRMRYQATLFYNDISGAMKGSDRKTLDISTTLSYTYKTLIFRNDLDYTRMNSANSPYGSFSDYSKLNQYWIPYDQYGNPNKELGTIYSQTVVYNPLYNASLNTKDESSYSQVQDNFNIEWRISQAFRATGQISYLRQDNNSDLFYPGSHTMFANYDANGLSARKGRYTKGNGYTQSVTSNVGLNFNQTFGKHLLFANVTWNLSDVKTASYSYTAEGFGNDYMDDITFANQYLESSTPSGSNNHTREIGVIGAMNYSYDDRYLFDASIRETGSSMYGSNNRWGTFWSLGLGWNLHHEKFLANNKVIRMLKLRASMGYTGNQNFNPYQARARYSYLSYIYDSRYGASLIALPNYNLKWQKTMDYNYGVDMMLGSFLNMKFDYYVSNTSNLLSDITIAPSMGFSSYKENLGEIQNKGVELSLGFTPWRDESHRGWATFTFSAAHNKNKIQKIYDIFKKYNDSQNSNKTSGSTYTGDTEGDLATNTTKYSNPSTLYYEGQSMTAIWGVRSLGVDPMTGSEMYLTKDGQSTYTWNTADQVVIGDTNPKWHGTIGLNAGYQGFSFNVTCSYKWGGDLYNSTLVNKVENVSGWYNLDKRIKDAWRKPGDKAKYQSVVSGLASSERYTKPTSRFVQRNNELYFSSLNVAYDFYKMRWLHSVGLTHLKMAFYMNELLRLSSIKIERGTSYPYARNFTFSVQATF
jgi:TonB-linked SusC/RagA family outer membrane protein